MAFTQTDLDNIDTAIVQYATGNRIGSVTIDGDVVRYADITLKDLQNLRDIIKSAVEADSETWSPRTYAQNGGRGE